ncbi:unnamed protein product [Bursaphelenchus okinawaensis]|uniref:Uncharacterized protein n=1 Tax=Bursaphelenchus okinawaensis TaxID=465554 RepID=A0A811KEA7_9BILA|nr:unnamed protein product [Bursaphelenchus okinawaensis]CAG9102030.1 unnamed protein product [Bursaphelenchus okinawaensis]
MHTYDSYYHCLCGTHVHQGTFLIALLGCIQWGLSAFPMIAAAFAINEFSGIFIAIVSGIPPWCLLIGNRCGIAWCYYPHLFINCIAVAATTILAGILFFFGISASIVGLPDNLRENDVFNEDEGFRLGIAIIMGLFLALFAYIEYYLLRVVYRGYVYLKDECSLPANDTTVDLV